MVVGALLLVALALPIALQLHLGLPLPGFDPVWHPRRLVRVWRALGHELSQVQHARLWWRWKRSWAAWPKQARDVPFGAHGQRLMHAGRRDAPVQLLFLHGGGWGRGDAEMYPLLAERLAQTFDAFVVVPSYRGHPLGEFDAMVEDASDALTWLRAAAPPPERRLLLGHSAGAHLLLHALVRSREEAEAVDALVALAAPWEPLAHLDHEAKRGVESMSAMWPAFGGSREGLARGGSASAVERCPHRELLPPLLLLHGSHDATVPLASCRTFTAEATRLGLAIESEEVPGVAHAAWVLDPMRGESTAWERLSAVLRRAVARSGQPHRAPPPATR